MITPRPISAVVASVCLASMALAQTPTPVQGPTIITAQGLVPLAELVGAPAMLGGAPPNDNCADAVVEPLSAGGSVVRFGDNTGATDEFGYGNSVYEAFTTTECLDVTVAYCGTTPPFGGAFTFLFRNCPLDNLIYIPDEYISTDACGDGNFTLTFPQVPPGTYYYGVLQYPDATGAYQLTFTAAACSDTPPLNDACPGAIALVPSTTCTMQEFDVFGAPVSGASLPASACGNLIGDAADDVWFSFVANAIEHTVIVEPSQSFYPTVEVRSGGCDGTILNCAATEPGAWEAQEIVLVTGLTIGETYHVRVYDWYAGLPLTTTFSICVIGDPPVCDADAGTLAITDPEVCLVDGSATVSATPGGDATVPAGYQVQYILATAGGMIVQDIAATPSFDVAATGPLRIHTLVMDPLTLDLGFVEFGVTTLQDIQQLLIQGGGPSCGALDMEGATVFVSDCTGLPEGVAAGSWAIHPNPSDGRFVIAWNGAGMPEGYHVIDLSGRMVTEGRPMFGPNGLLMIDVQGVVAPGPYLFRMVGPGGTKACRLVIQP